MREDAEKFKADHNATKKEKKTQIKIQSERVGKNSCEGGGKKGWIKERAISRGNSSRRGIKYI